MPGECPPQRGSLQVQLTPVILNPAGFHIQLFFASKWGELKEEGQVHQPAVQQRVAAADTGNIRSPFRLGFQKLFRGDVGWSAGIIQVLRRIKQVLFE